MFSAIGDSSRQAHAPVHDAVGLAHDRGGRHLRLAADQRIRRSSSARKPLTSSNSFARRWCLAGGRSSGEPSVITWRMRSGMRRASALRHRAAERPADQADLAAVLVFCIRAHLVDHALDDVVARAEVQALLPGVRVVAEVREEAAQRAGGVVAGAQAGQHQHRMAVAARRRLQQRPGQREGRPLEHRAAFHRQQQRSKAVSAAASGGAWERREALRFMAAFRSVRVRAVDMASATMSGRATTSLQAVSPNSRLPA